jgi:hypothetical protein
LTDSCTRKSLMNHMLLNSSQAIIASKRCRRKRNYVFVPLGRAASDHPSPYAGQRSSARGTSPPATRGYLPVPTMPRQKARAPGRSSATPPKALQAVSCSREPPGSRLKRRAGPLPRRRPHRSHLPPPPTPASEPKRRFLLRAPLSPHLRRKYSPRLNPCETVGVGRPAGGSRRLLQRTLGLSKPRQPAGSGSRYQRPAHRPSPSTDYLCSSGPGPKRHRRRIRADRRSTGA